MAFDGHYLDWNQKRIKGIVDFYGHKFMYYKRILDLGCGYGDISGVLHRLGADVTVVDARPEHLKMVSKKFSGIKTVQADLDRNWPFKGKQFDLVLDLGLLCHLSDYASHLRAVCASTTHLVLETAVCDSDDPFKCISVNESKAIYDLSVNGLGCRPSAAAIEKILTECGMNFRRIDSNKFNTDRYSYDWVPQNNDGTDINKRRIWFAVKNASPIQFADPMQQVAQAPPQTPFVSTPAINASPRAPYKEPVTSPTITTQPQIVLPTKPDVPIVAPQARSQIQSIPTNLKPKIRLFYNYYIDSNPRRRQELDFCLQKNIENNNFDIIILDSANRPTFDFFFQKINQISGSNDINIICNTDIFFDSSITQSNKIGHKEVYALTRWDWVSHNNITPVNRPDSQDVWIIRGKVDNVNGNFPIGLPGSDNRVAHEFQQAGYSLINPARTIKSYHVHSSNIRNYSEKDRVDGPYLDVDLTAI